MEPPAARLPELHACHRAEHRLAGVQKAHAVTGRLSRCCAAGMKLEAAKSVNSERARMTCCGAISNCW
jgi:hypothetical protein